MSASRTCRGKGTNAIVVQPPPPCAGGPDGAPGDVPPATLVAKVFSCRSKAECPAARSELAVGQRTVGVPGIVHLQGACLVDRKDVAEAEAVCDTSEPEAPPHLGIQLLYEDAGPTNAHRLLNAACRGDGIDLTGTLKNMLQVIKGLVGLRDLGLWHGDLKLNNIMCHDTQGWRLIDVSPETYARTGQRHVDAVIHAKIRVTAKDYGEIVDAAVAWHERFWWFPRDAFIQAVNDMPNDILTKFLASAPESIVRHSLEDLWGVRELKGKVPAALLPPDPVKAADTALNTFFTRRRPPPNLPDEQALGGMLAAIVIAAERKPAPGTANPELAGAMCSVIQGLLDPNPYARFTVKDAHVEMDALLRRKQRRPRFTGPAAAAPAPAQAGAGGPSGPAPSGSRRRRVLVFA